MKKLTDAVLRNKKIFVGLEDSKRTWKLCINYRKMAIAEISMPTHYDGLITYFRRHFPGCKIKVMYEAGFQGFWLHDLLTADGIECIVTPPNRVTQEKVTSVKTDKIDARRLALNLENGDYKACFIPDTRMREHREISRTLRQIQRKVTSTKNQIRKFLDFHGLNGEMKAGQWGPGEYKKLEQLELTDTLRYSLDIKLDLLKQLTETRWALVRKLQELSEEESYKKPVKILCSFPGVGVLTEIYEILSQKNE